MDLNMQEASSLGQDYRYSDNQTFLKKKLIETHNKLIKELEINKQLEDKLLKATRKENEARVANKSLSPNKQYTQENQQIIEELSNKNELLRIDLESMRKRILNEIMQKNHFEELLKESETKSKDIEQEYKKIYTEIKKKEAEYVALQSNYNTLYQKYENSLENAKKLTKSLEDLKKTQSSLNLRILDLENLIKQEREKTIVATNDYKNLHKEYREFKSRIQSQEDTIQDLKNKLYIMQTKNRSEKAQGSNLALEKLTQEMNFMTTMYKQKEKKLTSEVTTEKSEKKLISANNNNSNQIKELVERLEEEQRQKLSQRNNKDSNKVTFSPSPSRRRQMPSPAKNQKQDASTLQNTIFQCHITKNKILNDIDKIDMTKVKTNQLLSKRRKLEDDLAKVQSLAEESRKKLKSLNINSSPSS